MKVAFFSNFLNHHQLPLCRAFLMREDIEFTFVATEPIEKDRLTMGYEDMNAYPFVLRAYEGKEEENAAVSIAETYDVVIFGATPIRYIEARMNKNLLSFRFCERSLKKGTWRRFVPWTRKKIYEEYIRYKNSELYILSASAYASHDLVLCGFLKERCFKWGYFPVVKERDLEELFKEKEKNEKVEILYAGRLLKLKRVMDSLKATRVLVEQGIKNFHYTIIGDGEEKERLHSYTRRHNLQEFVSFLPFMSPEEVRGYMDKADIYIFSSNFYEGWGAVVNESMNSACALLVSHAVGSAAYLIQQGNNGLVYECGNIKDMTAKLRFLLEDGDRRREMGKKAYQSLKENWNAETAVMRFLTLCNDTSRLVENKWEEGPCSKAEIIKNNWITKK